MSSELANKQKCLAMRNGVEIWIDESKADSIVSMIGCMQGRSFFEIDGRTVNVADLVGIFLPEDMESLTRKKNGEWKCKHGKWYERNESCHCVIPTKNEPYWK